MAPTGSIILMAVNALVGIAVPVGLSWYLVRKYRAKFSTILIGAVTFLVFALILRGLFELLVMDGLVGDAMFKSRHFKLWFLLYAGLSAGIFEETGCFLSMKYLMKKEPSTPLPAMAFGVGCGGVQMLFGLGLMSLGGLLALALNDDLYHVGAVLSFGGMLPPVTDDLLGFWECISMLVLRLSFSCLVWVAVRKGGKWLWLFPAAIALHALVVGGFTMLRYSVGRVTLDLVLTAAAVAVAVFAYRIVKDTLITDEKVQ